MKSTTICTMAAMGMALAAALPAPPARAGEVGFVEDFALARDRDAALKQLIPGTDDYFYYHCLNGQHLGKLDDVDNLLGQWSDRQTRDGRIEEIRSRQALLRYDAQPRESLDCLINRLGLHYEFERQIADKEADLPHVLDARIISDSTLLAGAMAEHLRDVGGLSDRGLWLLAGMDIGPERRRDLLRRLKYPDYPNLLKLLIGDLDFEHSEGFGSIPIHTRLTLAQMDELLKLRPPLRQESRFVTAYLTKLRPSEDVNAAQDPAARKAHLRDLWAFVSTLAPAFNSLKAHVLYRRLEFDRSQGLYDNDLFLAYLMLPRPCPYVPREYLENDKNCHVKVDLQADYKAQTGMERIVADESLVRDYLLHFLAGAKDISQYQPYVTDTYLTEAFAEAKITGGVGKPDPWYSMLPADKYQALKDRVDVDLSPANQRMFGGGEPARLSVFVKNVPKLIVKIYEINALNYYRTTLAPIGADIDLEGLVATSEKTCGYDLAPVLRVERSFEFPELKSPGTYVVEFIGNGRSSRALIQKGSLRCQSRAGLAGVALTVLDENNKLVTDARAYVAGHEYTPQADGRFLLPYSTGAGGTVPVVLSRGELATLTNIPHPGEDYGLSADFFVDRQNLLEGHKTRLVVRAKLTLAGQPVSTRLLEDVTLTIRSCDIEDTKAALEIRDFALHDDRESVQEFRVPANLQWLTFTLNAGVRSVSQAKRIELASGRGTCMVNGIDRCDKIEDLHLTRDGGRYVLDVLGRTGEPKPDRGVKLVINHRRFTRAVTLSLKTDRAGRIDLGELAGIDKVAAQSGDSPPRQWLLEEDRHNYPEALHQAAGQILRVPYMGTAQKAAADEFGLFETRGDTVVADRLDALKIEKGFVAVGPLPPGDYSLLLKHGQTEITIRASAGAADMGFAMGASRQLELNDKPPLQIVELSADPDTIRVQLANADPTARVHLAATRFVPDVGMYSQLAATAEPLGQYAITLPESVYLSGRDIGEEYRYILDRRYAKKFPGNMLQRPGLLLNPFSIDAARNEGHWGGNVGAAFGSGSGGGGSGPGVRFFGSAGKAGDRSYQSDYNFLPEPSVVLVNLVADRNGLVVVRRAALGGNGHLRVLATDSRDTACRELSLPERKLQPRDLRLSNKQGLDLKAHLIEQRQVALLAAGESMTIADAASARLSPYDSLAGVYGLFVTLAQGDPRLARFEFILHWPKMTPQEKRAKYSEFTCHELSFFLSRKDPEFFEKAVLPYLRNKRDKTFMDHYLLGDDLAFYAAPLAYSQLNAAERALLGQRLAGQREAMIRDTRERLDLVATDVELENGLFNIALAGGSLDTSGVRSPDKAVLEAIAKARHGGANGAGDNVYVPAEEFSEEPAGVAQPGDPGAEAGKAREEFAARQAATVQADLEKRRNMRQLYRALEPTEEYAENNYYHLRIVEQNASLVPLGAFWLDFAAHDAAKPFVSAHVAQAGRNFAEMMLALAVLDLPSESPAHQLSVKDSALTFQAGGTVILFHREIAPCHPPDATGPAGTAGKPAPAVNSAVLVNQNYFRSDDRYRFQGKEKLDKYVDEFVISTVYGCQIVLSNPTPSPMKLGLLWQVPRGAMPLSCGLPTQGQPIDLPPYSTKTCEYFFYFPYEGRYSHYGVHAALNGRLAAFAPPDTLTVLREPTQVDRGSWLYISQNGSQNDVLRYLSNNNIARLECEPKGGLEMIAWRLKDKTFFVDLTDLLSRRRVYNATIWSFGLLHNHLPAVREYLSHRDDVAALAGMYIKSTPLSVDPIERKFHEHLEYQPLVNARAHKFGRIRRISNERVHAQYMRLLKVLSYKPQLDDEDRLAVTYYLFLQDRVEEALDFLSRVKPDDRPAFAEQIQCDYLRAYAAFYQQDTGLARRIAAKYADHPVDRWRKLFAGVIAQLDELDGKAPGAVDDKDRTEAQTQLAATEAAVSVKIEGSTVTVHHQNVAEFRVNYYPMDVETLFSRSPFVQQYSGQFAFVKPNLTRVVPVAKEGLADKGGAHAAAAAQSPAATQPAQAQGATCFELPRELQGRNVVVEVVAGSAKASQACYANSLAIQVIEPYGQIKVADSAGKPLPKAYVKVYARHKGGDVRFLKDGYTDLRGRFDYVSVSEDSAGGQDVGALERLAILVLSENNGAAVREADPPKP